MISNLAGVGGGSTRQHHGQPLLPTLPTSTQGSAVASLALASASCLTHLPMWQSS